MCPVKQLFRILFVMLALYVLYVAALPPKLSESMIAHRHIRDDPNANTLYTPTFSQMQPQQYLNYTI